MSESEAKVGSNGTHARLNGVNGLEPFLDLSKAAWPGPFRELAEQGLAHAQESCEKIKAASEEIAEALRESYSSNAKSATDYGLKLIEISNANSTFTIDFVAHLLGSKSVTDMVTLSAAQARKAFDAASAQNKELVELAQKLVAETGAPIRKRIAKVLDTAG